MKRTEKNIAVILGAALLLLPMLGRAEGTSMGKPFDELWGAVSSLQQQVEVLISHEDDFISTQEHEADMTDLQGQIDTLSGRIDMLSGRIDAMQATETLTCGIGSCANTVPKYINGELQTCTPKAATAERCDGLDNDCDGAKDEDYPELGHTCLIPQYMLNGIKVCHPSGMDIMCQAVSY